MPASFRILTTGDDILVRKGACCPPPPPVPDRQGMEGRGKDGWSSISSRGFSFSFSPRVSELVPAPDSGAAISFYMY